MCGIVGYVGRGAAGDILLEGLKRLEYRGYDSSGIAVLENGVVRATRSVGKISALEQQLQVRPLKGNLGLGHTRWATHGIPSEGNAHPHADCSKKIVVVHNGIIENYSKLKEALQKLGHQFTSQTDTEVVAHTIEEEWKNSKNKKLRAPALEKAWTATVRRALKKLEGAYALGVMYEGAGDLLIAARKDCPLVLGVGEDENFLASDVTAVIARTRNVIFLQQESLAVVKRNSITCYGLNGKKFTVKPQKILWDSFEAEKSGYKHFMLKEMMEQPSTLLDALRGRLVVTKNGLSLGLKTSRPGLARLKRIKLVACGTSYHAALVAKYWVESVARIPCDVEIASEFRYRNIFSGKNDLCIFVSQSGETADTLAALRAVKKLGSKTLAVANVLGSSMTQEADDTLYTHCGPEIGVASTKAFTGQLLTLYLFVLQLAYARGQITEKALEKEARSLVRVPQWVKKVLELSEPLAALAQRFVDKNHFLYLGRHIHYPIALEGALKLKEISYIHAEGYPAGEMKHGPIALIDNTMPLFAILTRSPFYEKMVSNIEEAKARGATVLALATEGDRRAAQVADAVFYLPAMPDVISPIVNVVPLQLFAYHVAVLRGCDVDQPRNLAKSVTVE